MRRWKVVMKVVMTVTVGNWRRCTKKESASNLMGILIRVLWRIWGEEGDAEKEKNFRTTPYYFRQPTCAGACADLGRVQHSHCSFILFVVGGCL